MQFFIVNVYFLCLRYISWVSMHVRVCAICVFVHLHVLVFVSMCMHAMCVFVTVHLLLCAHARARVCVCVCVCAHECAFAFAMYVHVHVYMSVVYHVLISILCKVWWLVRDLCKAGVSVCANNTWNYECILLETWLIYRSHLNYRHQNEKFLLYMPWWNTGAVEIELYSFLTLVLDGGEWLFSCPGCFHSWGNSCWWPLYGRLGESHIHSGCFEEDKCINSLGVESWSEKTTWKTQTFMGG